LALTTAYLDAAGRTPFTVVPVELAGMTLKPGVYAGGVLRITGTLTLDAGGDPNGVFIFKAASSLITGSGSQVKLINGASSCNVFWQVTSSATLGSGSTFVGTVMALTSITLATGATVDGRVLARNGLVSLQSNTITSSPCVVGATVQVTATPTGAVSTGDGSTSGGTDCWALPADRCTGARWGRWHGGPRRTAASPGLGHAAETPTHREP